MSQVNGGGGGSSGAITAVDGTANQIDVSTTGSTATVSLDSAIITPGSLQVTGQILAESGSTTAPGISFSSTPTAGFFLSTANEIDLTWSSGDQTVRFLSSQTIFNNNIQTQGSAQIFTQDGTMANPAILFASHPTIGVYLNSQTYTITNGGNDLVLVNPGFVSAQVPLNTLGLLVNSYMSLSTTTPVSYPYTLNGGDLMILVDTSSARTINLRAAPASGSFVIIKDNVGSGLTNHITVSGNGNNIDGAGSATILTAYGFLQLVFNGTQWNVVSKG
jgi:hypothetical protein